jgi:hypothetical protein
VNAGLIYFFTALIIVLNMYISLLKTQSDHFRKKARQGRPADEAVLRVFINVRNPTFQIPE